MQVMGTTKRSSVLPKSSSEEMKPWEDKVLREVYAVRDSYAAQHGFDLEKIYADLKRRELKSKIRRTKTGH